MAITTSESEKHVEEFLETIASRKRCEWCGDDQKSIGPRSSLCQVCKTWKRRERRALQRQNASNNDLQANLYAQYEIEFARFCGEEGQIKAWQGPVSALDLEWELQSVAERFLGERLFGSATSYFAQFSPDQRRLLMYIFQRMTKAWLRHHRRDFARDAAFKKLFPTPNRPGRVA